jgi:leucyl aminopeptidase
MHYALTKTLDPNAGDCVVIGIFSNEPLSGALTQVDKQLGGMLPRLIPHLQEVGDLVWQTDANGHRLLVIHCGDKALFTTQILKKRLEAITRALTEQHIQYATLCLPRVNDKDVNGQLQQMVLRLDENLYQFLDFKSKSQKPYALESVTFFMPEATDASLNHAIAITQGIRLTRNLANLPANICTPSYLANQALELAQQHATIKTTIMDSKAIEAMGMGAFLAVAKGSAEPPQFIEIQYQGKTTQAPIVLVGKGVTFDSGGISIKPAGGMEEMKFDMAGAASVLGTIKACALLQLPIHVVGLIPTTENMPSGTATKPGDVVTSMSGQTIEIVNTDAEGRLILADALTYAERFKPQFVIDIATLTGAIIIALGHETTGLFTADDAFAARILKAAQTADDAAWRLPLQDVYQELIDSPIADIVNSTADRTAGSVTAACFLSRFAKAFCWAHLDIAGTAWVSGKKRNATGRPVSLLMQILTDAC